jgi:hypothetical protein
VAGEKWLEREGPPTFNGPGLARRNLDKRSVLEVTSKGIAPGLVHDTILAVIVLS